MHVYDSSDDSHLVDSYVYHVTGNTWVADVL